MVSCRPRAGGDPYTPMPIVAAPLPRVVSTFRLAGDGGYGSPPARGRHGCSTPRAAELVVHGGADVAEQAAAVGQERRGFFLQAMHQLLERLHGRQQFGGVETAYALQHGIGLTKRELHGS